jgi:hypothetical protein
MVELNVPELNTPRAHEIQSSVHPWKGYLYHVSFKANKAKLSFLNTCFNKTVLFFNAKVRFCFKTSSLNTGSLM